MITWSAVSDRSVRTVVAGGAGQGVVHGIVGASIPSRADVTLRVLFDWTVRTCRRNQNYTLWILDCISLVERTKNVTNQKSVLTTINIDKSVQKSFNEYKIKIKQVERNNESMCWHVVLVHYIHISAKIMLL